MNIYEISLWEDFPDTTQSGAPFLNERKICTIGSHLMTSQARAREPKMINNINGTNTFTFKIFYTYIDELTGEKVDNPFRSLLINERKVKVFWKDEWYELIIKNIEEDKVGNGATYTCKDLFITELSKNGYNIELTADLQNNSGTAFELTEETLKGSGWNFNRSKSSTIYQYLETPVYESQVLNGSLVAYEVLAEGAATPITIPGNSRILVSKQSFDEALASSSNSKIIQIIYADGEPFITHQNEMVVRNGTVYQLYGVTIVPSNDSYTLMQGSTSFSIGSVSTSYRGKVLVESQKTVYDPVFGRYVGVYKDTTNNNAEVYGFSRTEYSNPSLVTNLIANSSDFKNTQGWLPVSSPLEDFNISVDIYPGLSASGQTPDNYTSKGYLRIPGTNEQNGTNSNVLYNSGLIANASVLTPTVSELAEGETGGFQKGDKYVLRFRAAQKTGTTMNTDGIKNYIEFNICEFDSNYGKKPNTDCFLCSTNTLVWETNNTGWATCTLTCLKNYPVSEISKLGIFLTNKYKYPIYVEGIQFFKLQKGKTSYDENAQEVIIYPGEIALQGIANTTYKYYNKDHDGKTDPKEVEFLYSSIQDSNNYEPVKTFEKITTIEAKGSNRFNILQSIAEKFECWVRFSISHDNRGYMLLDSDGLPQKEVYIVENVGKDLGWSFIYGLDLKAIKRKIISEDIVSKTIVIANENEYAKNGFCTIERSSYNYPRESFILNLDYYVDQGLLDKHELELDLYSTSNGYIGYYTRLHDLNTTYADLVDDIVQAKKELNRQEPELEVLKSKIHTTLEKIESLKEDAIYLAGVSSYSEIETYLQNHDDNTTVNELVKTIGQLNGNIQEDQAKLNTLSAAVTGLKNHILLLDTARKAAIFQLEALHEAFFKKYSRYIQEGVWQSNDYIDDDKYYLDALDVAYTSSRPKIQYDINVIRLNYLEDFTSKKFNVGDICYIQDKDFFGSLVDGSPFKLQIVISEITSYFDSPEKDVIKVQNYKTQFEDLFQRITATTQSLQYSSGGFQRAASVIQPDKTLSFDLLQKTFEYNNNFILNAANQDVTWDQTGITIKDTSNSSQLVRIMSGGLFISNDGGLTWKNAVRGDGISADILTAGQINTSEIYIYSGDQPSFRWDGNGLTAYTQNNNNIDFTKFVRYDQYGLYGLINGSQDFVPNNINDVINNATFGLTWNGFFMKATDGSGSVIINSNDNNVIKCVDGNNDTTFSLNKDGSANFTGSITANSGKIGEWSIGTTATGRYGLGSLYYGEVGSEWNYYWIDDAQTKAGYYPTDNAVLITPHDLIKESYPEAPAGSPKEIGGIQIVDTEYKLDWRLIIGPNFGVDKTGNLFLGGGSIKPGVKFGDYITINQARQGSGDGAVTSQQGITFEQIDVNNSKAGLGINQNGVWLRRKDGGWATFNSNGWSAAGASDIRLKENINYDLTDYKDILKEIKLFSYNLKMSTEKNTLFGVSAQQLHELLLSKNIDVSKFSFLKIPKEEAIFNPNDANTFYQIDYQFLAPIMLAIVQDQEEEIKFLKQEIQKLKEA